MHMKIAVVWKMLANTLRGGGQIDLMGVYVDQNTLVFPGFI